MCTTATALLRPATATRRCSVRATTTTAIATNTATSTTLAAATITTTSSIPATYTTTSTTSTAFTSEGCPDTSAAIARTIHNVGATVVSDFVYSSEAKSGDALLLAKREKKAVLGFLVSVTTGTAPATPAVSAAATRAATAPVSTAPATAAGSALAATGAAAVVRAPAAKTVAAASIAQTAAGRGIPAATPVTVTVTRQGKRRGGEAAAVASAAAATAVASAAALLFLASAVGAGQLAATLYVAGPAAISAALLISPGTATAGIARGGSMGVPRSHSGVECAYGNPPITHRGSGVPATTAATVAATTATGDKRGREKQQQLQEQLERVRHEISKYSSRVLCHTRQQRQLVDERPTPCLLPQQERQLKEEVEEQQQKQNTLLSDGLKERDDENMSERIEVEQRKQGGVFTMKRADTQEQQQKSKNGDGKNVIREIERRREQQQGCKETPPYLIDCKGHAAQTSHSPAYILPSAVNAASIKPAVGDSSIGKASSSCSFSTRACTVSFLSNANSIYRAAGEVSSLSESPIVASLSTSSNAMSPSVSTRSVAATSTEKLLFTGSLAVCSYPPAPVTSVEKKVHPAVSLPADTSKISAITAAGASASHTTAAAARGRALPSPLSVSMHTAASDCGQNSLESADTIDTTPVYFAKSNAVNATTTTTTSTTTSTTTTISTSSLCGPKPLVKSRYNLSDSSIQATKRHHSDDCRRHSNSSSSHPCNISNSAIGTLTKSLSGTHKTNCTDKNNSISTNTMTRSNIEIDRSNATAACIKQFKGRLRGNTYLSASETSCLSWCRDSPACNTSVKKSKGTTTTFDSSKNRDCTSGNSSVSSCFHSRSTSSSNSSRGCTSSATSSSSSVAARSSNIIRDAQRKIRGEKQAVTIDTAVQRKNTGRRTIVVTVYTDGACPSNGQHNGVARGGVGVFFGFNDPRNISCRLQGQPQTNQRAELQAVLVCLQQLKRWEDGGRGVWGPASSTGAYVREACCPADMHFDCLLQAKGSKVCGTRKTATKNISNERATNKLLHSMGITLQHNKKHLHTCMEGTKTMSGRGSITADHCTEDGGRLTHSLNNSGNSSNSSSSNGSNNRSSSSSHVSRGDSVESAAVQHLQRKAISNVFCIEGDSNIGQMGSLPREIKQKQEEQGSSFQSHQPVRMDLKQQQQQCGIFRLQQPSLLQTNAGAVTPPQTNCCCSSCRLKAERTDIGAPQAATTTSRLLFSPESLQGTQGATTAAAAPAKFTGGLWLPHKDAECKCLLKTDGKALRHQQHQLQPMQLALLQPDQDIISFNCRFRTNPPMRSEMSVRSACGAFVQPNTYGEDVNGGVYVHPEDELIVQICTDSAYVVNCLTTWMQQWKANNWKKKNNTLVKNRDLLEAIDVLLCGRKRGNAASDFLAANSTTSSLSSIICGAAAQEGRRSSATALTSITVAPAKEDEKQTVQKDVLNDTTTAETLSGTPATTDAAVTTGDVGKGMKGGAYCASPCVTANTVGTSTAGSGVSRGSRKITQRKLSVEGLRCRHFHVGIEKRKSKLADECEGLVESRDSMQKAAAAVVSVSATFSAKKTVHCSRYSEEVGAAATQKTEEYMEKDVSLVSSSWDSSLLSKECRDGGSASAADLFGGNCETINCNTGGAPSSYSTSSSFSPCFPLKAPDTSLIHQQHGNVREGWRTFSEKELFPPCASINIVGRSHNCIGSSVEARVGTYGEDIADTTLSETAEFQDLKKEIFLVAPSGVDSVDDKNGRQLRSELKQQQQQQESREQMESQQQSRQQQRLQDHLSEEEKEEKEEDERESLHIDGGGGPQRDTHQLQHSPKPKEFGKVDQTQRHLMLGWHAVDQQQNKRKSQHQEQNEEQEAQQSNGWKQLTKRQRVLKDIGQQSSAGRPVSDSRKLLPQSRTESNGHTTLRDVTPTCWGGPGKIEFVLVKGHSGVTGNEMADRLACAGAQLPLYDAEK